MTSREALLLSARADSITVAGATRLRAYLG